MTEDNGAARVSSNESTVSSESSEKRQRRKRKWDQPAEFLVSAGAAIPGIFPMANIGSLVGASSPVVAPVSVQTTAGITTSSQLLQASPLQQNVAQTKIQDELIAREMVINDAESSVRYKLTKRQTQEEIQKCTGAVVITRGKYRPPNAPPDGEKPLYLHISASAHLKEMSERIIAVDRAAAMVEEMLKQGSSLQQLSSMFHAADGAKLPQVSQSLSTCVYLGFEADPVMNIVTRIRGPNDQYINHIMNETGVNVLLRGRGSGNLECTQSQEQEPLHLFLSGSNSQSLEEARCLAENLLDTISIEFGASRASSHKVYNAVPPPSQLVSGVLSPGNDGKVNENSNMSLSNMGSIPILPISSVAGPGGVSVISQGTAIQTNVVQNPHHSLGGGTSYNGYGGIYPQATALQQVALALRQPPSPLMSIIAPTSTQAITELKASVNTVAEKDKKPPQRRKFQELPVGSKGSTSAYQGSSIQKKNEPIGARHISMMPPPMKLLHQSNGVPPLHPRTMPPPPSPLSRMMPPPPPPPKFTESAHKAEVPDKKSLISLKTEAIPDTLIKLMEYGEEDDDDDNVPEERNEESLRSNINAVPTQKPFWAL